ncbi:MAG: glycosyltransferase family 39 protein [Patescibacteria group bacterium]
MKLSFRLSRASAVIIIAIAAVVAYASAWNDSIIVDEDPHIGAGYSYVAKQDMRLNPEHPPLAKDLAGIALLPLELNHDAFATNSWTTNINDQWEFGRKLIYHTGNNAELITHVAKIPPLIIFIIAGWMVFWWTRQRYGDKAGLLAVTLFSFSPTVMAHSRFVTTDIPAALGVLIATYWFVRYLKEPTRKYFWYAAVMFGLALLMKFSTVLLIPLFVIVACTWNWRMITKTALLMIVGFVVVVWPVYAFHVWHYPIDRQHHDTETLLQTFGNRLLADPVVWASGKPILRAPAQYGLGLLMVTQRSAGGNTVYFRDTVTTSAGPIYFPFVYLIKEPLSWLALLLTAITIAIARFKVSRFKFKDHIDEIAMILWLVIYWATSIHSTLNIGVRHLLPVYPFMIILVSGQLVRLPRKVFFAVPVLIAWFLLENFRIFPYYLTYFNQTVGGPSGGYRYVVDSNLDWGQDLKRFADWVEKNDIKKIELDYFGWADQQYYLGDSFVWLTSDKYKNERDFLQKSQTDGWLAISATFLQNEKYKKYSWLADYQPVTTIGNSIFVYNISGPRF